MKRLLILLMLIALLVVAHSVWAMSSTNYRLDWFTPFTSGGGGAASSTHYAINFTIGQTASDTTSGASYQIGLGYWHGVAPQLQVYLPLVLK